MLKEINIGLFGARLYQLKNEQISQMMSYIIVTENGHILVLDGGTREDAKKLLSYIESLKNPVDLWLISHLHYDHIGAVTEIFNMENPPEILNIVYNAPDIAWFEKNAAFFAKDDVNIALGFMEAAKKHPVIIAEKGMKIKVDNIIIEILTDNRNCENYRDINSTSIVYRIDFGEKTALFLGDLSFEHGEKLACEYGKNLKSDIVQMAHHGQDGVSRRVYELISPEICLWPTPDWLWDNNSGGGYGSGPWKTLEVRKWMAELCVKQNITYLDGDVLIR